MLGFMVGVCLGAWSFHQLAVIPAAPWVLLELAIALVLFACVPCRPLLGVVLAFLWSHTHALLTVPPPLPVDDAIVHAVVSGRVVSLPQRHVDRTRFLLQADAIEVDGRRESGSWRFQVSWYEPPGVQVGDAWRLPLRIRAVHGYAVPGAWDFEGAMYWQGVRYTAYVASHAVPLREASGACCQLQALRDALSQRLDGLAVSPFARGVLRALVVGDQAGLRTEDKALFRATGTSHLMAISGLHIGLLAGLAMGAVAFVWRRLPAACERIPARFAGATAGMSMAIVYAALAGMGLPTQRALIMLLAVLLTLVLRRQANPLHGLGLALLLVLAWHPPAVVSAGFWLSFVAVLAILVALQFTAGKARWRQAVGVQLAVSLGLWPVLAAFDLTASALSPVANLALVPLFGLLIVPLSLLAAALLQVFPVPAETLFNLLAVLLDRLHPWLAQAAELNVAHATAWPPVAVICLAVGVALLLVPPGFPGRHLLLPLVLLGWLPRAPQVVDGDFDLYLLDVGQGLSSVIVTHRHVLVFDTGPEFRSGFSTAAAVVRPFLRQLGVHRVDRLVLSHGDNDHAGGVPVLLDAFNVRQVQSGEPTRTTSRATHCVAGESWQWDGVGFEFLHPPAGAGFTGNDASCVLRVSNAGGSVLLTGDIGARIEQQLVNDSKVTLASDVVVAAHHGSLSSSSEAFVEASGADYVLYASGWANRYGFPRAEVHARWADAGALAFNTAESGTLRFRVKADDGVAWPEAYRATRKRFWQHDTGLAELPHAVSSGD